MTKTNTNIPVLDVKIESKNIEGGRIIHVPWIIVSTPYMIFTDSHGTRKIWIKSKRKIALYYLYKFTNIKWFIRKYNE